jgi:prolyl-tRNA synthetase
MAGRGRAGLGWAGLMSAVARKYRDEARPRHGLLRSKEFTMKDLYTFDHDVDTALDTYARVRQAYDAFFNQLGVPFLTAEADSGDIGGSLNHEYHYAHPSGEDTVWTCNTCDYAANDEVVAKREAESSVGSKIKICYLSHAKTVEQDSKRQARYAVVYKSSSDQPPSLADVNVGEVKRIFPTANFGDSKVVVLGQEEPRHLQVLLDSTVRESDASGSISDAFRSGHKISIQLATRPITAVVEGDGCSRCKDGTLTAHRTIEVGHTFFLGTKYTKPLGMRVSAHDGAHHPQMGCYGIGVSRLIQAIANVLMAPVPVQRGIVESSLRWPREIAPFSVGIVPFNDTAQPAVNRMYDELTRGGSGNAPVESIIHDDMSIGCWDRLRIAKASGWPITVMMGRQAEVWPQEASKPVIVPVEKAAETIRNLLLQHKPRRIEDKDTDTS